jgi:Arc/MetJ-type ribon-helix-helix transcriptional regulator
LRNSRRKSSRSRRKRVRRRGRISETAFTSITIPVELAEKIKRRIQGTGFTSLSSYVVFVLREILGQDQSKDRSGVVEQKEAMGNVEKQELLKRLKNLGYI